jgi:hypothetical protein
MSGETWTTATSDAETWTNVADASNGYMVANYVRPVYVSFQSGNAWAEASDASTTWSAA